MGKEDRMFPELPIVIWRCHDIRQTVNGQLRPEHAWYCEPSQTNYSKLLTPIHIISELEDPSDECLWSRPPRAESQVEYYVLFSALRL